MKIQTTAQGKPTLKKYRVTMTPHLLAQDSKKFGISQKDKARWKELVKYERNRIQKRYDTADAVSLWQDMEFKRKMGVAKSNAYLNKNCKSSFPKDHFISDKEMSPVINIVGHKESVDESKVEWIASKKHEYMLHINKYETIFAIELSKAGIKSEYRQPFVSNGKIYFASVYLPSYRIAFDIIPYKSMLGEDLNDTKKNGLRDINVRYIRLYYHQASNPEFVKELVNTITTK